MEAIKSTDMQRDIENKLTVKMMTLELGYYDDKEKLEVLDEIEDLIKKYKWSLSGNKYEN